MTEVKQCALCGRTGTRGFASIGPVAAEYHCAALSACVDRQLARRAA